MIGILIFNLVLTQLNLSTTLIFVLYLSHLFLVSLWYLSFYLFWSNKFSYTTCPFNNIFNFLAIYAFVAPYVTSTCLQTLFVVIIFCFKFLMTSNTFKNVNTSIYLCIYVIINVSKYLCVYQLVYMCDLYVSINYTEHEKCVLYSLYILDPFITSQRFRLPSAISPPGSGGFLLAFLSV